MSSASNDHVVLKDMTLRKLENGIATFGKIAKNELGGRPVSCAFDVSSELQQVMTDHWIRIGDTIQISVCKNSPGSGSCAMRMVEVAVE